MLTVMKSPRRWLTPLPLLLALAACGGFVISADALSAPPDHANPGGGGGYDDDGGDGGDDDNGLSNPAFVAPGDKGIFLVASDGTAERLTRSKGKERDRSPVWSPDGSLIAFLRNPDHTKSWTDLYTIHPDGTGLQLVRSFDSSEEPAPAAICSSRCLVGAVDIGSPDAGQ